MSLEDDGVTTLGHWVAGAELRGGGRSGEVHDPAKGALVRRVMLAGGPEVDAAVASAAAAFPAWSDTPAHRRARVLFRFRDLVERNAARLAALISEEHGKTVPDALGEIQRGLEVVEYATGIASALKGEHTAQVGAGVDAWSSREPLGVVAGVSPFNFPAMVPMWMFPVAIACGNTFVMKPSERVPSAAFELGRLLGEAGLPDGVFNVVNGDSEAVHALVEHPAVEAVSFVGSTRVAEAVHEAARRAGKRVQALGGAKNHMVIMPDADVDQAAEALVGAAFGSTGQRCMAVSVAVAVGDATADALRDALAARLQSISVGPGTDPGSDMGPLISAAQKKRVVSFIDGGERAGAELVVDGRTHRLSVTDGYFVGPTLFDRVRPDMAIYREEIFGPVLCIVRADNLDDALRVVNGHEYGNGAAIFTRDGASAARFTRSAKAGMVGVNVPLPVPMAFHSFGGWKRSLFGEHHMHGPEGVRFFTRLKAVTQRWPEMRDVHPGFAMPTLA